MSIQRLTVAQMETNVLELTGFVSSATAPWNSSANFYIRLNSYVQRLPIMAIIAGKQAEIIPQTTGALRFDMYRTKATITGTSGSSTIWMPTDYDQWISVYDTTQKVVIEVTEDVSKYFPELRTAPSGPPKALEILDFESNSSIWQRKCLIWPTTASGTTPSFELEYWRLPAAVSSGTDYVDIDPKYEQGVVFGLAKALSRSSTAETQRWQAIETECLLQMASTAKAI